jgi:hypothetical protein
VVRGAIFVTTGPPIDGHPDAIRVPDGISTELEALLALQGRARGRGVAGLILAAPRWIERWRRRRHLVRRVLPVLSAAIEEATTLASGSSRLVVTLVVCLGGVDVVAAERLRASGRIVIAPGGLRWLGDRRAAPATGSAPQPPAASSA